MNKRKQRFEILKLILKWDKKTIIKEFMGLIDSIGQRDDIVQELIDNGFIEKNSFIEKYTHSILETGKG